MVQLMLDGFGGDRRSPHGTEAKPAAFGIECYHVNARLSRTTQEIGSFQARKVPLLIGYCLQAIWCRFRYNVPNFYYVPAPGKSTAVYRDWLVMMICRPFFKGVILHWHAAALADWLENSASWITRWLTQRLLGHPELSIVLSQYNIKDGQKVCSRQIRIVQNGIADPCPEFEREVLPRRLARLSARKKLMTSGVLTPDERAQTGPDPHVVQVLYLSQCSRQKGLFDALDAVALANTMLKGSDSRLRFQLQVAGEFVDPEEKQMFDARIASPDLWLTRSAWRDADQNSSPSSIGSDDSYPAVEYLGFLSSEFKNRSLAKADCLCFPTYYHAESFGLVIIEAMAFGLPVLVSRWRSIPELLPESYPGFVEVRSPTAIAKALHALLLDPGENLRSHFLQSFCLSRHLGNLAAALLSAEP